MAPTADDAGLRRRSRDASSISSAGASSTSSRRNIYSNPSTTTSRGHRPRHSSSLSSHTDSILPSRRSSSSSLNSSSSVRKPHDDDDGSSRVRDALVGALWHPVRDTLLNPMLYLRFAGLVLGVFTVLSVLGATMTVVTSNDPSSRELAASTSAGDVVDWQGVGEATGGALEATALAAKLWGRLLLSIILPTSHVTWVITQNGWTALQPSLREAFIWFINTDPLTKLAVVGTACAVIAAIVLEREIRKRKYVERVVAASDAVYNRFTTQYEHLRDSVAHKSLLAVQILPHALYLGAYGTVSVLFPVILSDIARGYYGWAVMIAWPVFRAARALLVYETKMRDAIELKRVEELSSAGSANGRDRSQSGMSISNPQSLARATGSPLVYMQSVFANFSARATSTAGGLLEDAGWVGAATGSAKQRNQIHFDPERVVEEYEALRSVVKWLRYWTVMGVPLLLEQLPVTGHVIALVPAWPVLRLAYSMWLQIPGTHGSDLAFKLVVPLINKYFKSINTAENSQSSSMFLNFLFGMGFINADFRVRLVEIFDTGGTLILIALPFMFAPGFISYAGTLVCGLGYPIYSSSLSLLLIDSSVAEATVMIGDASNKRGSSKRTMSTPRTARQSPSMEFSSVLVGGRQSRMWLEYWVVYAISVIVQRYATNSIGWLIPFWNQGMLLWNLYLQLPYFRGAHAVFKVVNDLMYQWSRRTPATPDLISDLDSQASDDDAFLTPDRLSSRRSNQRIMSNGGRRSTNRKSLSSNGGGDDEQADGGWFSSLFFSPYRTPRPPPVKRLHRVDELRRSSTIELPVNKRSKRDASNAGLKEANEVAEEVETDEEDHMDKDVEMKVNEGKGKEKKVLSEDGKGGAEDDAEDDEDEESGKVSSAHKPRRSSASHHRKKRDSNSSSSRRKSNSSMNSSSYSSTSSNKRRKSKGHRKALTSSSSSADAAKNYNKNKNNMSFTSTASSVAEPKSFFSYLFMSRPKKRRQSGKSHLSVPSL